MRPQPCLAKALRCLMDLIYYFAGIYRIGTIISNTMQRFIPLLIVVISLSSNALGANTPPLASGRDASQIKLLKPADVLARLDLLSREIDLIRQRLGRPKSKTTSLDASGISPHEVYFQARALLRRLERFSLEQTGTYSPVAPPTKTRPIIPGNVWGVVNQGLARVIAVKKHLELTKQFSERAFPEDTQPGEVFKRLTRVRQQLEGLLLEQTQPGDVFEEVTRAIHLAAKILALSPGTVRLPDAPALQKGKLPKHVHQKLSSISDRLRIVLIQSGFKNPAATPTTQEKKIKPADVQTMAIHVASQLSTLHSLSPGAKTPLPAYYAGKKTPSDVFQRVGTLEKQLETIETLTKGNPGWLH